MATVTEPRRTTTNLKQSAEKVQDPLRRLRGYIRGYVITEAVSTLVFCLAALFWIGLLLDYGSFKLFGLDWARDMPRWLRAILLALGLVGVGFIVEIRKTLHLHAAANRERLARHGIVRSSSNILITVSGIIVAVLAGFITLAILRENGTVNALVVGLVVAGVMAAFTTFVILKRLMIEFNDPALALVLERQFPDLLGDRLITAVELHDPKAASKFGYSAAMIEETIHEAGRRVGKLNLREVFDWTRMYRQIALALVLTIGGYLAVFGTLAGVAAAQDRPVGIAQFTDLNDTAAIWAERNVLLDNERWPTRALIGLVGFPRSGELKKGKGSDGGKDLTRVDLKASAVEYAFHDSSVPDCWRQLTLADLRGKAAVSATSQEFIDKFLEGFSESAHRIPVDQLKLSAEEKNFKAVYGDKVKTLLEEIDELAARPSLSRTVRKLIVPGQIYVYYKSDDGQLRGDASMESRGSNDYDVELALKDSVNFVLSAEDYVSGTARITLVPPPRVALMRSYETRPAYLHHLAPTENATLSAAIASTAGLVTLPAGPLVAASALHPDRVLDDDVFFLRDRKQLTESAPVDVQGSLKPSVKVPMGADVILRCETDKPLVGKSIRLVDRGKALAGIRPQPAGDITNAFSISIKNVRTALDFRLEFIDTDGAEGVQEMEISPNIDGSPTISQFRPELVRQVGDKYRITPNAIVPFSFFVTDDYGLAGLDFVYSIKESTGAGELSRRGARAVGGVGLALAGPEMTLLSYLYNRALPDMLRGSEARTEGRLPVPFFQKELASRRKARSWRDTQYAMEREMDLSKWDPLKQMVPNFVYKDLNTLDKFLLDPEMAVPHPDDRDAPALKAMDVLLLRRNDNGYMVPLKARPLEVQRRFEMSVYLEARDTNIERETRGTRESQPYSFEVVSEIELLYDIGLDEQRLYDELFRISVELKNAQEKMQAIRFDLPSDIGTRVIDWNAYSVRVEDVQKTLAEGVRVSTKVLEDYEKLYREMRINRIENRDLMTRTRNDIIKPLKEIKEGTHRINVDGENVDCGFVQAENMTNKLRGNVDNTTLKPDIRLKDARGYADDAEKEIARLTQALNDVLAHMASIVGLNEILAKIIKLEEKERLLMQTLQKQKDDLEKALLKDLNDPKKPEKP